MSKRDYLKHLGFATSAAIAESKIKTMEQSNEELLKPRYKVIADYPGNVQPIGHIHCVIGDMASTIYWCNEKDNYPHLFKKLQWWEDRKLNELPEYVKCNTTPDQRIMPGMVLKVAWRSENWGTNHVHTVILDTNCYVPATREEYEQYINQQNKANDTE